MIRQIYIYKKDDLRLIFHRKYANIGRINFDEISQLILPVARAMDDGVIDHSEIFRYRISYGTLGDYIVVMINNRSCDREEVEGALTEYLRDVASQRFNSPLSVEEERHLSILSRRVIATIPAKVCFVGFGGVGKTTLLRLLRHERIPLRYEPTMFGERAIMTLPIGPYRVILFTVGGQERFMPIWDILIRGSDVVVVVTDSTPDNVERTKSQIMPMIRDPARYSVILAIANKQDLPKSLPADVIEQTLGIKTYGCVAIDPAYRSKIMDVIKSALLS
ncbi:MAG: ADP-ribosylation factor-like protein [Candidatus Baldrarchaeia archaeon]